MEVYDLVLSAKSYGSLYEGFKDLAKRSANLKDWRIHVRTKVIPEYRKECHEPMEGMSLTNIEKVAKELKEYYEEHIEEL